MEVDGRRIGLRSDDAAVVAGFHALLPRRWLPLSPDADGAVVVDRLYSLRAGGRRGFRRGVRTKPLLFVDQAGPRGGDVEELLVAVEEDLQLYLSRRSRTHLYVHAGAVARGDGALLLPGPSGAGKSTLVGALVAAGCRLIADDMTPIGDDGRAHPYPRPSLHPRAELAGGPLPVRWVVVCRYRPGTALRLRRLRPGAAVLALLSHAVAARERPAAALEVLHRVAATARFLQGQRGEATSAARELVAAIDSE